MGAGLHKSGYLLRRVLPLRALLALPLGLGALGLSGCGSVSAFGDNSNLVGPDLEVAQKAAQTAQEKGITIGEGEVDANTASLMFKSICVDPFPDFTRSKEAIANHPFNQNPESGTYYHNDLSLSVKLAEEPGKLKSCSMVFRSDDEHERIVETMRGVKSEQGSTRLRLAQTDRMLRRLYQAAIE